MIPSLRLNTLSQRQARYAGLNPDDYPSTAMPDGPTAAVVDGLVWAPDGKPALVACLSLTDGTKAGLWGFQSQGYLGLRDLAAGDAIWLDYTTGPRGGRRWSATKLPELVAEAAGPAPEAPSPRM